jgi:GTP-binding protein HflX
LIETSKKIEKAIAITVVRKGSDRALALEHLDELAFLAETAGAIVIEKYYQELAKPNVATMIGKGKVQELKEVIEENEIDLVIFDEDLSPVQMRNLEKSLKIKVLDRSSIILDIFASRAQTIEAKTQVELAQMQYLMPRLTRMWTHLSKQYGGIGTKGPGETQIETDRRIVRNKIQYLKGKLADIEIHRENQRKSREGMPRFALVGYTNAGKSTLMHTLTNTDVYIENKLFATLDTTVRGFELPNGTRALLSDTVGFIRKLPAHLVASFRSTLAEAKEADVLVHVVDVTHDQFRAHIEVVDNTLDDLKIFDIPTILVFNKIDLMEERIGLASIKEEYSNAIFVSAERGININSLLDEMQRIYDENSYDFDVFIPYDEMDKVSKLYGIGDILEQKDDDDGSKFHIRLQPEKLKLFQNLFQKYIIEKLPE